MRYHTAIEVSYLPQEGISDAALASLQAATLSDLEAGASTYDIVDFAMTAELGRSVHLTAALRGKTVADLTSPLDALRLLDISLRRALMHAGLFEEFDVARRAMRVSPL
ncbi:MAG TPA: hypothetical protein VK453_09410 [Micromonosporaceae bacterium]|nr:hypothetical protein [Micromonosporaceae bacterium]